MIIPVRCFTCGKVLADKWEAYVRLCSEAEVAKRANNGSANDAAGDYERPGPDGKTERGRILDRLGIVSCCCRTAMMTHVDLSMVI
jgi:DNA-directed RNA polymerase I, II, and III subunit RPABC5